MWILRRLGCTAGVLGSSSASRGHAVHRCSRRCRLQHLSRLDALHYLHGTRAFPRQSRRYLQALSGVISHLTTLVQKQLVPYISRDSFNSLCTFLNIFLNISVVLPRVSIAELCRARHCFSLFVCLSVRHKLRDLC